MVIAARSGDAPIDGDEERPALLGFGMDEIWSRERKELGQGSSLGFYKAQGAPRHTAREGGGASAEGKESTSSCWPPCALERMRMNSSSLFLRRGTWAA
jgi:hypothetical protein